MISENIREVLTLVSGASACTQLSMEWFRLSIVAVLWQASLITGQCFLQELTTTQGNGVTLHSKEINLKQEIIGFLSLTSLLRQENFLIKK